MADEGFLTPDAQSLPLNLPPALFTNDMPLAKTPSPSPAADNSDAAKMQTRAEIDTSAPFESVKEAANRFGGIGFWRPSLRPPSSQPTFQQDGDNDDDGVIDMTKMEKQALFLEKDLIVKERETLDVLKELESTKNIVEELKRKLQKETSEKENHNRHCCLPLNDPILCPSSAPGFILMELKQAKLNLSRTTTDLAGIRSIVETYNKIISDEKISLEKSRNRVSANTTRISSMEEELKYIQDSKNGTDLSEVLKQLNSEAEQYKKTGEFAKTQVVTTLSDIEQTKRKIETVKIRLYAAEKMKEAARASEAIAMAEIKALSSSSSHRLTLSHDEYMSLTSKAQESEESSKKRVKDAMVVVEKENLSQMMILKKIEEASEEAKSSKRVLEEALNRVESANMEKLGMEEALRKWRSDHSNNVHRRRSVQNNTKFKNVSYYPSQILRKDPRLLDVNGMNMVNDDEPRLVCRPIMSIGQILSRKLESDNNVEKNCVKRKVSLGQMLSKPACGDVLSGRMSEKENGPKQQQQLPAKRKKFGFGRFSVLVKKQNKRKKMTSKL